MYFLACLSRKNEIKTYSLPMGIPPAIPKDLTNMWTRHDRCGEARVYAEPACSAELSRTIEKRECKAGEVCSDY